MITANRRNSSPGISYQDMILYNMITANRRNSSVIVDGLIATPSYFFVM